MKITCLSDLVDNEIFIIDYAEMDIVEKVMAEEEYRWHIRKTMAVVDILKDAAKELGVCYRFMPMTWAYNFPDVDLLNYGLAGSVVSEVFQRKNNCLYWEEHAPEGCEHGIFDNLYGYHDDTGQICHFQWILTRDD